MFVAAAGATPRGIDRVDMGYAGHLLSLPGAQVGLLPSPFRMGVLTRAEAVRLRDRVERNWREARPPEATELAAVGARLGGVATPPRRREPGGLATFGRYAGMLADAAASPLRAAARAVPAGAVYVNTGQVLLGSPWFFAWLARRPDVKPVFLLHDVIPLLFPEYTGPLMTRHHERAVATVARHGAGLVATSRAAADEIGAALARLGRRDLPTHVVPLPVSDSLLRRRPDAPEASPPGLTSPGTPYFVTVGNLDQRKNHLLLLQAWRAMAARGGPLPKLVIVGARGLRVGGLADLLDRSTALAPHVVEARNLSSPAMRAVILGARAVLMPSFTEGFGLPIVEALSLGTPVIASDIPVHREVGGPFCTYLHPLDGTGWMRELLARAAEPAEALAARRAGLSRYRPRSWSDYFGEVMPFLQSL